MLTTSSFTDHLKKRVFAFLQHVFIGTTVHMRGYS